MFTGIVDRMGSVLETQPFAGGMRVCISTGYLDLEPGESISVDGVCLTVLEKDERASFDLSEETLSRSALRGLSPGVSVNLERALRLGDRLGGHWVTGHVDALGRVLAIGTEGEFQRITVGEIPAHAMDWLLEKGSVTVNGVSLTVNGLGERSFWFTCIPHTLERTNLGKLEVGMSVNLEFDWMVKAVLSAARRQGGVLGSDSSH